MTENEKKSLQITACKLRKGIVTATHAAKSGHPGGSMSSTDFLTALFFNEMNHDPATWTRSGKGQDMFILSAGHLTPVYYSVLARRGYFPVEELGTFRKIGTRLQGHPSIRKNLPGVFQASGSLGQGLSAAAGLALGKKLDGDPGRVWCLCGDGESEEGQIWEAGMLIVEVDIVRAEILQAVLAGCNHVLPTLRMLRKHLRTDDGLAATPL